ncbi:MAG: hypothetical protein IJI68_11065 [Eggerthellaceae bacterium]|nr:hypothetical protein [Eggerthellaceae bacterium]
MKRSDFCSGWEYARDGGSFEAVVVPHDAMLGGKRGPDAPGASASGYYYGTSFRYRKSFQLTAEQASGPLFLEFEGVYRNPVVEVNGARVDAPPYGFVPFIVDLAGVVHQGANVIEIAGGNANQPDCRWYTGAGIHRQVWLWEPDTFDGPVILPEGIRVTTVSVNPAVVRVDVDCTQGEPRVKVVDAEGSIVVQGAGARFEAEIPHARLWSAETPCLYRCHVELFDGGSVCDRAEVSFGIRQITWSPSGLFVNGKETLLRGGCIHADNGVLGAASFPAGERRRIRLMKEAGFNSVRMAHNPASGALLDACDEVGMYVIDETWDVWYTPKSAHDYAAEFLDWCDYDLSRLVAHDYNHPSVISYSIGNEIADPIVPQGVTLERSLVDLLHALDSTRPVTCGFNLTMMVMERAGQGWYDQDGSAAEAAREASAPHGSMLFNLTAQATGTGMTMLSCMPGADKLVSPALDALDIAGYNYGSARYRIDARVHPKRIMLGTETFPHELVRNWAMVERIPALIGDFMWAGWDYLGEAGAGAWAYTAEEAGFTKPWPWLLAGSGALDILGQPGAPAALAGAVWKTADAPSIQVRPVNRMNGKTYRATWRGSDAIPSWSWAGCEGATAQVEVYDGQARSIRLDLNGEVVGERLVRSCVAKFSLAYWPGTLTAVALDGQGREISRSSLRSATGPFRLDAHSEASCVRAGSIAYVPVCIVGSNGVVDSNADERVDVAVEGGILLGFGSAQPAPTENYLAGSYTTYRGRALAVVYRADSGIATLTAAGETYPAVSCDIQFV